MKFIFKELENPQSFRKGSVIDAVSLTAAKRAASRRQQFQGTVLVLETDRGTRLAIKEGKWKDAEI